MASLIEHHHQQILGVLSCFDRVVIRGTLPSVCHANAMATALDSRGIWLFDYATKFAQPFRESIRAHVERVAAHVSIEVEHIKRPKSIGRRTAFARSSPSAVLTLARRQGPIVRDLSRRR